MQVVIDNRGGAAAIANKINAELNKALAVPEFGQRLMLQGDVAKDCEDPQGCWRRAGIATQSVAATVNPGEARFP